MAHGVESEGNRIEFLLDGHDFIAQLDVLLERVRVAPRDPNTYVRMSYLELEPGLRLPSGVTLAQKLGSVAQAGHAVQVAIWSPDDLSAWANGLAGWMRLDALSTQRVLQEQGGGRVEVCLATTDRFVPGTSLHQKITIVSLRGQRVALVSGANPKNWYDDTPGHSGAPEVGFHGTLHDTSLQVEGPATDAIEEKWAEVWSRSGRPFHRNRVPQQTFAPVGGAPVRVNVAATSSEGWARRTDIQALLVK